MPKVKEGSSYIKKYSEDDIQLAIKAITENKESLRQVSKKYGIPRSTIQFRMGPRFRKVQRGPPRVLTDVEENMIVTWILENTQNGTSPKRGNVLATVNSILESKPRGKIFKDDKRGHSWYNRFLKRHPEIPQKISEAPTSVPICTISESNVQDWFLNIEADLQKRNWLHILKDPKRLFLSDEIKFILSAVAKTNNANGQTTAAEIHRTNSEKIKLNMLFIFSAIGYTTPPNIVLPYKNIPERFIETVPKDWGITKSENGLMKPEEFYEYIRNIFYHYLIKNSIEFPVILFVDGYSSNFVQSLSEACEKFGIILIALYARPRRRLQRANLDVEYFAPFVMNSVDFCFKPDIIRNDFKVYGLYPWHDVSDIDYSKCLSHRTLDPFPLTQQTEQPATEKDSIDLKYKDFVDIVGDDLIASFKTMNITKRTPEFYALYQIWLQYDKKRITNESTIIIKVENDDYIEEDMKPTIFQITSLD